MKFRLLRSESDDYQEFMDAYWIILREFGLSIQWQRTSYEYGLYYEKQEDGSVMYAAIFIEIDSLEQLMHLREALDEKLIVDEREDLGPFIEIYDGYRE